MINVRKMGHAVFETPDLERAVAYYTQYLGLSEVQRDSKSAFLSCPADYHSVVLTAGPSAVCAKLGLELAPNVDMAEVAMSARTLGVSVSFKSDAAPDTPKVLCMKDPGGLDLEIMPARIVEKARPKAHGVVPRKLGHTAFFTPEIEKSVAFYRDVLGFRVSDWIGDFFVFMRCNPDHHTVNFLKGPKLGLHHIAFELNDWNHIKAACDLLPRHNLALTWGPGRHGPGHNLFTYHLNSDGFTVEMFTELDTMSNEELGFFDPRPWHFDTPQRPKVWDSSILTRNFWGITKPEPTAQVGQYK